MKPSRLLPVLLSLAAALLTGSPAAAAPCPVPARWPVPDWPSRAQEVAQTRAAAIQALEQYAFTLTGTDAERKGVRTDGVVVVHRGEVVYERYARGFTAAKRHLSWSVTKSFTGALVGRAVGAGALRLDTSICEHLSLPAGAENCAITVQNLLEMASGLDWAEVYENRSNQASSVLAMLYGEGRKDMAAFVASHPRRAAPGTLFSYSTGESTLLSAVVAEAVVKAGLATREDFPWTLLLDRIGLQNATWERDAKGHLVGGSYLYATPRDLARFGYLYLQDGCWQGAGPGSAPERLLPEDWVARSSSVNGAFRQGTLDAGADDVYGWQFWLNRAVPETGRPSLPWPDVPGDAYAARGHWGQSVTIIPSLDLVVVRTADDRDGSFDFNRFLSLAIALVR
jgi:CubicO group peptidase (beta-lactamase class C family)